jgi:hypothetical protein
MTEKKSKRGGARPGAGRPRKTLLPNAVRDPDAPRRNARGHLIVQMPDGRYIDEQGEVWSDEHHLLAG